MSFVDLDPAAVAELARERASAELAAQRAAVDVVVPIAPAPGAALEPTPEVTITPAAHAASVEMICSLLVLAGGREVPLAKRQIATQLTFAAAQKYGGEIPYMVELCAVGGLVLIAREAFFTKDPTPADAQEKKAA